MPRYWVPITNSTGTAILVEADSPEEAAAAWDESQAFQELGGLCHACEHEVGSLGDWELVADNHQPTVEELTAVIRPHLGGLGIYDQASDELTEGIVVAVMALLARAPDPLPHITPEDD